MSKYGPIVPVAFENQLSDTRPWDLCGCAECEPMRMQWVEFFKRQHDTLLAQKRQSENERGNAESDDELRSLEMMGVGHGDILSPGA